MYSEQNEKPLNKVDPAAMEALTDYRWPGNVRELQNYIERSVVVAENDVLTADLLPRCVLGDAPKADEAVFRPVDNESLIQEFVYNGIQKAESDADDLHKRIVEPVEKELLRQVLDSCNLTQTKAAVKLGINRNTLYKKMKEYGLEKNNGKTGDDSGDKE